MTQTRRFWLCFALVNCIPSAMLQMHNKGLQIMDSRQKTLVIACGALSHELIHLTRANNWEHLDVTCVPAKIHHTPAKIPGAFRKKIQENRDHYGRIFAMMGDCGTAGELDKVL